MSWKDDNTLKQDLEKYVRLNMKRVELLDFVSRDYVQYKWSLPTLDRRLRHFEISYINKATPVEAVIDAVRKEIDGPGKLLGYRALNQKLRSEYDIRVPCHLVYNVMAEIDPDGLDARQVHKKIKKSKVPFTSKGPMWLISVDGHDKLCGYQNWRFPLGVYGFIDTFSRKMLSLSVVHSNSDPLIIGKLYLDLLYETKFMPCIIRMDKGTETGKLATMHVYLLSQSDTFDDPMDAIIYGPSTSNKIERWLRDLHHRLEKYFKAQLRELLDANE